jgi:hypothetical protein
MQADHRVGKLVPTADHYRSFCILGGPRLCQNRLPVVYTLKTELGYKARRILAADERRWTLILIIVYLRFSAAKFFAPQ